MDEHDLSNKEFSYVKETVVDKAKIKRKKTRIIIISIIALIVMLTLAIAWVKFGFPIFTKNTQDNQLPTGEATNPIEIIVDTEMVENQMNIDDYKSLYNFLKEAGESASKYVVTISVINKDNDWLSSYPQNEGITSGIITGIDNNIYILTDYETVNQADKIMVKFINGISVEADMLRLDENSGVAILYVPIEMVDSTTKSLIGKVSYGNSEKVEPGDPIIIVGNPYGDSHYMTFGVLTSTTSFEQTTDSLYKLLITDVVVSGMENGFIINLDGKVIGMISSTFGTDAMSNVLSGVAIADLKSIIRKLSEDKNMPYLGVNGQEINDDIIALAEENMPYGIFVKSVEIGSPAYNLGIASGDIIVKLDNNEVITIKDYIRILENKNVGEEISIVLNRKAREGYSEYHYSVVLESR